MLESLRMGPRYARGRRDARAGHVRTLTVSGSLVVARVRAPDDDGPGHRTRIAARAYGAADWARAEQRLAAEARYVADLLAGRMPADVDTVFDALGMPLLPSSIDEIAMDCDCGGWSMPCTHLAATCYALAASFETDPFGVFAWRGRSREELLLNLRELRGTGARAAPPAAPPADPVDFWGVRPEPAAPVTRLPGRPDALLDELGPLIADGVDLAELLRPAYRAMGGTG
jgi:uncharacterized Zn finger protein